MKAPDRVMARRQILLDTAKMVCGVGAIGLGLALHSRHAQALPVGAIRPPGAGTEADFQSACIRCGLCVRDCPYNILGLATLDQDVATGTPFFVARNKPCEMCEDIPCVKACPTGALDPALTEIGHAKMGLAVLVDHETCLNFQGLRCDVCYRVCPLIDKAITLDLQHNERTQKHTRFLPTVHSDACTGCGKCESACVLTVAAIKVFPVKLSKGELGAHYRLGWEEKRKAGKSLVEDRGLIDLPDRMPQGLHLPGHSDPGSDTPSLQQDGGAGVGVDSLQMRLPQATRPSQVVGGPIKSLTAEDAR